MIKSKHYEEVLQRLVEATNDKWDLERLEVALKEAVAKVSNKQFKLKQNEFKTNMGGK